MNVTTLPNIYAESVDNGKHCSNLPLMAHTGMDLKVLRTRKRVTTIALAERAGWKSRQRISQIEALAVVPEDTAGRYLEALATFTDVVTSVAL